MMGAQLFLPLPLLLGAPGSSRPTDTAAGLTPFLKGEVPPKAAGGFRNSGRAGAVVPYTRPPFAPF